MTTWHNTCASSLPRASNISRLGFYLSKLWILNIHSGVSYRRILDTVDYGKPSDKVSIKPFKHSKYSRKFRNSALRYIFPVMLLIFGLHFSLLDWLILKIISYISFFCDVFLNILSFKIISVNAQRFFFIYLLVWFIRSAMHFLVCVLLVL